MKRYKNLIASIIIVLVFLIVIVFLYKNYKERSYILSNKIEEWKKKNSLASKISSVDKEYRKIKEYLLPDFFRLKRIIDKATLKYKIEIELLKPSSRIEKEVFSLVGVDLKLKGAYKGLLSFIEEIESYPAIGIRRLRIGWGKGEEDILVMDINLVGLIKR